MRIVSLACLLLTLAAPALAEDRYGPQNNNSAAVSAAWDAPVARLSWPGKVAPALIEPAQDPELPRALADGSLRRTSVYGTAPLPAPPPRPAPVAAALVADAEAPPAENARWRRLTGISTPRQTEDPTTMDNGAATPEARPTTAVATPGPLPAAQAYTASTNERASASTGDQARYYSLHREYGETPDAIPKPEKSQVFLAGGPLNSGVGEGDEPADSDGTGKTAAMNKARLAADWGPSSAR